jgi:rsbT co-antagonist protein RsbR
MGIAIVGMHFTGMAAANFTAMGSVSSAMPSTTNNVVLATGIAIATLVILGLALLSSFIDRRFAAQSTALATSELRYQSLFEHNPDAVYSLDLAGQFVSINPATTTLTGFQAHELLHTPFLSLTVPDHTAVARQMFERTMHGESQHCEIAVIHKAGHRVEWSITNLPIVVNEQIVGVYGIAKDITQRKQAEQALQQSEAHLRTVQQQLLDTIQALSTPVLPIYDQILVLPLIGTMDSARSRQLVEAMLAGVAQHRANMVLLDVTGVPVIDTAVANHLMQATQAVRLLGAQVVLVGISPTIAQTLVQVGLDLRSLTTCANLASGLQYALKQSRIPV